MAIMIDRDKCIGCGACAEVCVRGSLEVRGGCAVLAEDGCMLCGHCVAVCPMNAVSIPEYRMDLVEELTAGDLEMDPEHLRKFLAGRRSIRRYRKMAVEQEKLEAVLETGRTSPTASNRQNLRFAVIRERLPEIRELAVEALYRNTDAIVAQIGAERYRYTLKRMHDELPRGGDRLFFGAPAVIVVIERGSGVVNGALAASRMELMAASLGLGVCYNGFFARAAALEPRIPELLGMGEGDRIAVTFAVGYPDVSFLRTAPRRDLRVEWL